MSAKVVEADVGIHSLAMSVAVRPVPTTSFLLPSPFAQWKRVLFNCFSENPLSSLSRAGACTVRFYFLRHQRLSSRFTHSSPLLCFRFNLH